MPVKIGEALVSFGKYTDKNGKSRAKNRIIGDIMQHTDGRIYIAADRAFNPGALPAKEGSDVFYIGLSIPNAKVVPDRREPGYDG